MYKQKSAHEEGPVERGIMVPTPSDTMGKGNPALTALALAKRQFLGGARDLAAKRNMRR